MTGVTAVTGTQVLVAVALAGCAVLVMPAGGALLPRRRSGRRSLDPRVRRMLVTGLGVLSAALLLSVPAWTALALTVLAVLAVRFVPARRRPMDPAALRDLACALDLLATCLEAGLPVARSITAVLRARDEAARDVRPGHPAGAPARPGTAGTAPPGRAGASGAVAALAALSEVAALLALGADPESAWRPAAGHPDLADLAVAARRSALGGVRLADAVRETAAGLRCRCRETAGRSAARAGVAMTAPLALCFLPAFVCLGLAPVIIGLISTLHIW